MIQIEQKIIEIGKHIYLLDLLPLTQLLCAIEWEPLFLYYPFLKKKMENRFSFVTNISIDLVIVSY